MSTDKNVEVRKPPFCNCDCDHCFRQGSSTWRLKPRSKSLTKGRYFHNFKISSHSVYCNQICFLLEITLTLKCAS